MQNLFGNECARKKKGRQAVFRNTHLLVEWFMVAINSAEAVSDTSAKPGRGPEYLAMVVTGVVLFCGAFLFPYSDEVSSLTARTFRREVPTSERITILVCLVIAGFRAFVVSSLEAATAMLLNTEFARLLIRPRRGRV